MYSARYTPRPKKDTIIQIANIVCDEFEISMSALKGKSRAEYICAAKCAMCYHAFACGHKAIDIAEFLGYRDHTTVSHYKNVYDESYFRPEVWPRARDVGYLCVRLQYARNEFSEGVDQRPLGIQKKNEGNDPVGDYRKRYSQDSRTGRH